MANLKDTIVLGNLTVTGKIIGDLSSSSSGGLSGVNFNGSGNAVTGATYSDNILTLNKDTTFLTSESDTLQTVTDRGASTTQGITVKSLTASSGPIRISDLSNLNSLTNNYISAGGGHNKGSGNRGLKVLALEQSNACMGMGVDLCNAGYELVISTGRNDDTTPSRLTFATSSAIRNGVAVTDKTVVYKELGGFTASGKEDPDVTFYVNGSISGTLTNGSLPLRLQNYSTTGYADANSAVEQGWHYMNKTGTNRPPFKQSSEKDYRIMTTAYSNTWLQQIATDFRCNDMFIRRCESGTWKPWTPIVRFQDCTSAHAMQTITDNAIARWDSSGTAMLQNSGITIDDNNILTTPGHIQLTYNNSALITRTGDGWWTGVVSRTSGDEAVCFEAVNDRTSWMFRTKDPRTDTSTWTDVTPTLHIKRQRVAINKLIPNGGDADYTLDVNGTVFADQFRGNSWSCSWYQGRDSAVFRNIAVSGYHALWSLKTTNGSWDLGEYSTTGWHNIPVLTYIQDAHYNTNNNTTTYQIKFPLASGTIALTSNIPNVPSGRYVRSSYSNDGYSSGPGDLGDSWYLQNAFMGSVDSSSYGWQNLINIRHRGGGGESDNGSYGLQIRTSLVSSDDRLYYRHQVAGTWYDWIEVAKKSDVPTFTYSSSTKTLTIT